MSETQQDMKDTARSKLDSMRHRVRDKMGGAHRIEALHEAGLLTARERIELLLDAGSFQEIGTFASSEPMHERDASPGDGKIVGFGTADNRPVAVAADDATVKGGSSTAINIRKIDHVYRQALRGGHPLVYFGEARGSRIPDTLGSEGMPEVAGEGVAWGRRGREVPLATVITGPSFGGSSFIAAMSDLVVQVRGSCLAVVSPRVIEIATGERIDFEELGGVDVHSRRTGQIDLVAESDAHACELVRTWLSYLPSSIHGRPPVAPPRDASQAPLSELVPSERQRGYNVRKLIAALVDAAEFLELKPDFGRALFTGLARLNGHPVGVMASNPMFQAGALDPDCCDKGTRFLCLCDSFDLPVVILQDSPGFLVGSKVEHNRAINKTILFLEALALMGVPRFVVILRKSYGLSYTSLGGYGTDSDLFVAWPGAEIGFMDPDVAVNVLYGAELGALRDKERQAQTAALAEEVSQSNDPFGSAAHMYLDEIIDPEETRAVLVRALSRYEERTQRPAAERRLRLWPTCW